MSRIQALERKLGLNKKEEVQPSGFGTALEAVFERSIDKWVREALEEKKGELLKQVPDMRSRYTDFKQVPAPAKTAPPVAREVQLQRDELGRIDTVNVGNMVFHVQRGNDGRVTRLVPADIAPPTPAVPPAPLNEA